MDCPDVSVIIPCYSRSWELSESIESVLSQTFQNFELILVDNNAKPATREVIQKFVRQFPDKVRVIHEPEQGVCSARNAGILASRGRFVALQDEDDMMKPHRLERQRELLLSRPDLSLATSGYDLVSPDGKRILKDSLFSSTINTQNSFKIIEEKIILLLKSLFSAAHSESFHFHVPSAFMFPKEVAIKVGLFDTRLNPQFLEDYEFQVRMIMEGPFGQVPESLFCFRESPWKMEKDSFSQTPVKYQVHSNWHQNDQVFFYSLCEHFAKINSENDQNLKKIKAVILRTVGSHALRYPDGASVGADLLKRSFKEDPSDIYTLKLWFKTFLPKTLYPRLFWFDRFEAGSLEKIPKDFGRTFLS
ncbi:glycosyltransferase family 2 protein [Leptospirillum ferrooxidans]|uniref:Putative glycosyl transferase, family 2 n=1 Tax=Leptospirillum ferrooxidans (strain C2-3) TaxID=1162668 RepID=I0IRN8_LEPFC|nr:glycosyltransferase family 2 protein [Leptospirillum ferrooxidans]BAM07937.1 putative glycosyl transferase, family 2 [Leptospirillum ferrooxidans C2-3]